MGLALDSQELTPPGWTRPSRPQAERVRSLLARDFVGFAQHGHGGGGWVETPTGTVTVILNLGPAFGGLPDAFVAGISDRCSVVEQEGDISCLDIKLTPLGAFALIGTPMHEIAGLTVDARELFGRPFDSLVDRVRETSSWDDRFELLDDFLARRAELGPRPAPAAEWAWRRLLETGGRVPIRRLTEEIGCSSRYLAATFREQVGLPPKMAARIIRFNQVLRLRRASAAGSWADVAVEHGYYDQAHLYRDFHRFAGTTPVRFFQDRALAGV